MEEYRGDRVLATARARFLALELYEDCLCRLVLTRRALYVFEDAGTGEAMIIEVPRADITGAEPYRQTTASGGAKPRSLASVSLEAALSLIGGSVPVPTTSSPATQSDVYLKLDYLDAWRRPQTVFFGEFAGNMRRFIKAVQNPAL